MMDISELEIEEKILKRIPFEIAGLSAVLSIPLLFFFDITACLLFFAGGLFSAVNFIWLKSSVSHFLLPDKRKPLASAILLYAARLILIIAVFFIIILFFSKQILIFVAGFSSLIIVFFIEAASTFFKLKQWKS